MNIDHVADAYKRYPGDTITYFTRVEIEQAMLEATVRIQLPPNLVQNQYQATSSYGDLVPDLEVSKRGLFLAWHVGDVSAGTIYEYETTVRIASTQKDMKLISEAVVTARPDPDSNLNEARESVMVHVQAKGNYMKNLPALYDEDEMMGRYVMLFESFWQPIETQIDHIPYYFDCKITPIDFLEYLAWWLCLDLDERWSEDKKRLLVCAIIQIYRKRGTKWGLSKFLEIYTGIVPEIIEHRAKNFVLGPTARLGQSIAMGYANRPHTFTVKMTLPTFPEEDEAALKRLELERLRTIEHIIEFEKPAHTGYKLDLTIASG